MEAAGIESVCRAEGDRIGPNTYSKSKERISKAYLEDDLQQLRDGYRNGMWALRELEPLLKQFNTVYASVLGERGYNLSEKKWSHPIITIDHCLKELYECYNGIRDQIEKKSFDVLGCNGMISSNMGAIRLQMESAKKYL